jgi:hypothetical protein
MKTNKLILLFALILLSCTSNNTKEEVTPLISPYDDEEQFASERETANNQIELYTNQKETSTSSKSTSFYKDLLEDFCKALYHDMFEGRTYIYTSLHIDKRENTASGNVIVSGTHSYEGRFGKKYEGFGFKATIRVMANKENTYYIVFEKEGVKFISQRHYWESSSRAFVYEE